MNKKKGSAMILAILLLAFFMALSLNMWFISQKKAQRAGDKIIGNSVLTDIDGSSTLGYYEFYLATEYMTKGFVTTGTYTVPASTVDYTSGGAITPTIQGIWLENEKEYFGSYLSTSGALNSNSNALLKEDNIDSNNKLRERNWEVTGGAIVNELWEASDWTAQESFGKYKISTVLVDGVGVSNSADLLPKLNTNPLTPKKIETNYVKNINLTTSNSNKNEETSYIITVKRTSNVTLSSGAIQFDSDQIEEIIVTKQ